MPKTIDTDTLANRRATAIARDVEMPEQTTGADAFGQARELLDAKATGAAIERVQASKPATTDATALANWHNECGLAFQAHAKLTSDSFSYADARAAYIAAFKCARGHPGLQSRIKINHAALLHMLAAISKDSTQSPRILNKAEFRLRYILERDGSLEDQDRARAQDTLGNVLTELGRPQEAIPYFIAARDAWLTQRKPLDRAQTLNNLAAAYVAVAEFEQARVACKTALAFLSPTETPEAWTQAMLNQGRAALGLRLFEEAIAAFGTVLDRTPEKKDPFMWSQNFMRLVGAKAAFGEHLLEKPSTADQCEGKLHIESAIHIIDNNIHRVTSDAKNELVSYRADFLLLINKSLTIPVYPRGMTDGYFIDDKLRDIFSELAQSGIPESERLAIIVERVAALFSPTAGTLGEGARGDATPPQPQGEAGAGGTAQAAHDAKGSVTGKAKPRPAPPPGHQWPTETYSGSPEAKRGGGGIVSYLERVWLPIMKAAPGLIDRATLRAVDRSAAIGINNFPGRRLPPHLDIPVQREITDRKVRAAGGVQGALKDHPDLIPTIITRMRRGVPIPN